VYYASDRVHRSDDRGQSWREASGDLTRGIDRNKLKVMGKVWPMDAVAKNVSTTPYGNIVALAESPINEDLLYAGTDDGLVHVSTDGGKNWTRYDNFPNVPDTTYVNEIIASAHDENVVYVAFNNHKRGDFKPYLLKSTNQGKKWSSVASNLPEGGAVYAIAEDPKAAGLLFVGTEYSCFATVDGGKYWRKLSSGLPTVAVRDINIQERENDLVLATFGRGFYIMDDYSALRELSKEVLEKEAHLFSVRDAFQYLPYSPIAASNTISWLGPKGFQGETYYLGDNPEFGAAFTYFLKEGYKSLEEIREEEEGERREEGEDVFYPTYDQLSAEAEQKSAFLIFTVRDANGELVDEVRSSPRKGINRVNWDLKYPDIDNVNRRKDDPTSNLSSGIMVLPGNYTVELAKSVDGTITELAGPVSFRVKDLKNRTLPATDPAAMLAYHRELTNLSKNSNAVRNTYRELDERLTYYRAALRLVDRPELNKQVEALADKLKAIRTQLYGDPIKQKLEIDQAPSISNRINTAVWTGMSSLSDPTKTSAMVKAIAEEQLGPVMTALQDIMTEDVPAIDAVLDSARAPWTPGRVIGPKN